VNSADLVVQVIDALEAASVPYMITGSLATNLYGIIRSTKDADFVIQLGDRPVADITRRLPQFKLEPQMSFETITSTTRYRLKHAGSEFLIELFLLSDDAHDQERFRRRRRAKFDDRDAWAATAEDAIITKLRWSRRGHRAKDLDDARDVLAVQGDSLDLPYLEGWCAKHGTLELLNRVRAEIPR
jgi:hypothetical protein